MAKSEIKLSDFKRNEENPFMKQAVEEVEKHIVKKYRNSTGQGQRALVAAADIHTGEIFKTSFLRQMEVDEEQFVKLYLSNFAAFFDLSKAAIRVFGYFMQAMKPKNDMVVFLLDACMEYTGYKAKDTIYRGLAELVHNEIIARGPNETLWFINPLIVFNGDRVSFTKTFVKKKSLAAKEKADKNQLKLGFPEETTLD
jgi:hypothetical protein